MSSREKPPETKRTVRVQVWIEVGGRRAITGRGVDLLDLIAVHGSLRQAAQELKIGYRLAWDTPWVMNESWQKPLVKVSRGGHHGGGMILTKTGEHVLRTFRDLQLQVDHLVETVGADALAEIDRATHRKRVTRE